MSAEKVVRVGRDDVNAILGTLKDVEAVLLELSKAVQNQTKVLKQLVKVTPNVTQRAPDPPADRGGVDL